ncbi:MAG: hypothetical protein AAB483_03000 [Patescibacteria group bacterium]
MIDKIRDFVNPHRSDIILFIVIVCITIISFNLGRMSVKQGNTASLITPRQSTTLILPIPTPKDPRVVASKASSSKLYHFTYCSGAARISEKNKVFFPNDAAAIAAGYSLAANCQK